MSHNFDGIQYELSQITKEYSLFLFLLLLENKELIDVRRWFSRFRHRLARVARTPGLNSCRELDILMPALFDCLSIKIETQRGMGFDKFQKLSTSFIFEFAYSTAIAVRDYKNIEDFFAIPRLNTLRRGRAKVEKAPHRIYSTEIVDMYTRAISSRDPYIKFISFYQIMEYFYDQVFKIKLVSIVKNKLTHPEFSYRKESKIFDVIKTIKKELKTVSVDGWGNEIKSLELVLEYYVKPDELLDRIDKLDRQAKDFYINNNVAFCSAAKINFDDTANIFKAIAKRIYKTRNALVHSKEEYISERYIQYKHEQILKNEITLVQAIAESVIINSADEMRD